MFFGLPFSLITGTIALAILSLGFFGAYKRCSCLLKTYAVIRILELVFHFLVLVVAVVVVFFVLGVAVASTAYPDTYDYYFRVGPSQYFNENYVNTDMPMPMPHSMPMQPAKLTDTTSNGPITTSNSGSVTTTNNNGVTTTTTTTNSNQGTVTTDPTLVHPTQGGQSGGSSSGSGQSGAHGKPITTGPITTDPGIVPPVYVAPIITYYGGYAHGYVDIYEYYSADLTTSQIIVFTIVATSIVVISIVISLAYYAAVFYTVILSFRMARQMKQQHTDAYSAVAQKECQLNEIDTPQPFVYVVADPNGNQPVLYQMQNLA
jgi:hypothetical protein